MTTRPADASDYDAFVRLFAELATGDDIPSAAVWSGELAPSSLVHVIDGTVVGYIYVQSLDVGFVRHLAIDPAFRGRGLGRSLMRAAAKQLRDRGIEQWCLNVKPDNVPALALYEGMGMARQFTSVAMRMGWDIIGRLPTPSSAVAVLPLQPPEDPDVERALALPRGLLERNRARPGARLLVARDGELIVGAAVFRPEFPGAYPFRARDGGVASALMAAMRPHAIPTKTFMQLVLEDSPGLEEIFGRAGASRHLEIVQLRGPVPEG